MASALDVAKFLIHLAVSGDEPDPLTHLRLQKLLYYVQGWHLAAFGTPIFPERIEAWTNGPVVPEVWRRFKVYGQTAIFPLETDDGPSQLSNTDQEFVKSIWDEYKVHSALRLWPLTHGESPWLSARRGLPADVKSSEEISPESLRAFFSPRLEARMPKGISPAELVQAEQDIDRGCFRTHQEMKARFAGKKNAV